MSLCRPILLGLSLLLSGAEVADSPQDVARLREMLSDQQHPRNQSQAALVLVQSHAPAAEEIVRQGLRHTNAREAFFALTAALRLARDARYQDELLAALAGGQPDVRQAAAATLAELGDVQILRRLQALVEDPKAEWAVRQAAVFALGQSGRREAVVILLDQLSSEEEKLRQAASDALLDATGQTYGLDVARWRSWWELHKGTSNERWLEERLDYQTSRARRLQGELDRARSEIARLHQQLYSRLPAGDRLAHVRSLVDSEDGGVRLLAVNWCQELLPTADAVGQRTLAELLLRLSHDSAADIQRSAVLALGGSADPRVFERLLSLLQRGPAPARGAAAHAMAQQIKVAGRQGQVRQREVIPALQKALDDPSLEVVVEAAESLGTLGAPEAGPVLTVLLRHPSRSARQTAALALERVADVGVLDGLLQALDDPEATVRFSLVGALAHAAGDGHALTDIQRLRLLGRLEGVLLRDADPGVRSRAATVLAECGSASVLPILWQRLLANEDPRVQDKAWTAMIEIIIRSGNLELLQEWDRTLCDARQASRRIPLLTEAAARWQKREETKKSVTLVQETLVQAQLSQGKWLPVLPIVRELLAAAATDNETDRRLRWLLAIGQLALKEGNRQEAQRVVREAQPYLSKRTGLSVEFEKLDREAKP